MADKKQQGKQADLSDIRKRIVKSVAEFLGGQSASDDVTLMLLRRLP